jgi:hypothetical protein
LQDQHRLSTRLEVFTVAAVIAIVSTSTYPAHPRQAAPVEIRALGRQRWFGHLWVRKFAEGHLRRWWCTPSHLSCPSGAQSGSPSPWAKGHTRGHAKLIELVSPAPRGGGRCCSPAAELGKMHPKLIATSFVHSTGPRNRRAKKRAQRPPRVSRGRSSESTSSRTLWCVRGELLRPSPPRKTSSRGPCAPPLLENLPPLFEEFCRRTAPAFSPTPFLQPRPPACVGLDLPPSRPPTSPPLSLVGPVTRTGIPHPHKPAHTFRWLC